VLAEALRGVCKSVFSELSTIDFLELQGRSRNNRLLYELRKQAKRMLLQTLVGHKRASCVRALWKAKSANDIALQRRHVDDVAYTGGKIPKGSRTATPNGSKCLRLRDRIVSP